MSRRSTPFALTLALALAAAAAPAGSVGLAGPAGLAYADQERPKILQDVGLDQRLGQPVPLDLVFRDEKGAPVRLGDYLGTKPAVLALVYYECPMLCTLVLNGAVNALDVLSFDAGKEFDVIAVSINPKETPDLAAAKKTEYLRRYHRTGAEAGWHFLTGEKESIDRLAAAVGFRYKLDPVTGQYAHTGGIMILTPQGRLARYFYGVEYPPRDLRLALVEAGQNRIGSLADHILLFCYEYDPATGKYGVAATRIMRLGGILVMGALGGYVAIMFRRESRASRARTA
jgi:protein SCO1/2